MRLLLLAQKDQLCTVMKFIVIDGHKKTRCDHQPHRVFVVPCQAGRLLDLGFLVDHVLADHGIKLLGLHLFRMQTLVLGGGVKVPGAR